MRFGAGRQVRGNAAFLERDIVATSLVCVGIAAGLTAFAISCPARAQERDDDEKLEQIVVQATRSGRRLEEEAIRVDVVDKEELDEKLSERPGDISMLLSEIGGLRTQITAPSLGAANVRIQGMRGRYTQVLTDGLPLTGGQESSLGLLQVTPSDLAQVEIIKGAASALYGPSALGGVVNLVSRRPTDHTTGEFIANATSRNGQDLTGYVAAPLNDRWGYTLVGSANRQSSKDLDGDGWIDIPGYKRWTLRPRVFWTGEDEANGFFTLGAMDERRKGGTLPGRTVPDGTPFPENLHSQRLDGGFFASIDLQEVAKLQIRGSGTREKNTHRFGSLLEDDNHGTVFAEAMVGSGEHKSATTWLAGVAFQSDDFHSDAFPAFAYKYTDPGLFGQIEHDILSDLTVAGSARVDFHNQFGTRFSPRLSALYHPGPWSLRASFGGGFYAPTPFVEEIEAAGLSRLEPLRGLKVETARTASLDGGYAEGPFEAHVTLFESSIRNAVQLLETSAQSVRLVNSPDTSRTHGGELMLRYKIDELTVSGSYVHVIATEADVSGSGRRLVPLTPRDTAGVNVVWEKAGQGKLGFETFYTGPQHLEDNPYRNQSRPYVELGVMGEIVLGKFRLFLNLENLLNVRQTKYDPLLLRARSPDGRWTVDAWAPLDGFVANAGVRFQFGGT
jgi:iron complex outermembrane receptor protein